VNPKASTLRELFSHLDPLPESDGEEASKQSTTESDLIEKIEWEFGNVEGTSSHPESESKGANPSQPNQCTECGSDLSLHLDPNYCPDCGTKL
jgi:membrane protease subunit (stomatin/prohibitin family)